MKFVPLALLTTSLAFSVPSVPEPVQIHVVHRIPPLEEQLQRLVVAVKQNPRSETYGEKGELLELYIWADAKHTAAFHFRYEDGEDTKKPNGIVDIGDSVYLHKFQTLLDDDRVIVNERGGFSIYLNNGTGFHRYYLATHLGGDKFHLTNKGGWYCNLDHKQLPSAQTEFRTYVDQLLTILLH